MCAAANRSRARVSYGPMAKVFGNLANRDGGGLLGKDLFTEEEDEVTGG